MSQNLAEFVAEGDFETALKQSNVAALANVAVDKTVIVSEPIILNQPAPTQKPTKSPSFAPTVIVKANSDAAASSDDSQSTLIIAIACAVGGFVLVAGVATWYFRSSRGRSRVHVSDDKPAAHHGTTSGSNLQVAANSHEEI
jgi:hypothetical protein